MWAVVACEPERAAPPPVVPEAGIAVPADAAIPPALTAALRDLPTTAATADELLDGVRASAKPGKRKLGEFHVTANLDGSMDKYTTLRVDLPPAQIAIDCLQIVLEDGAWTAKESVFCDEVPLPRCAIREVFAKGPAGKPDATRGASYQPDAKWKLRWPTDQGLGQQLYDDDCDVQVERP